MAVRSHVTRRLVLRVALIVALGATSLSAASQFRSGTDLVVLHVNVFDEKSDAVPDLPQSAFLVLEDDRPQQITFFGGIDVPVAAGLLIDNSSSMITKRNMVAAGTRAFVASSHPEDELFTISFNEHVRYGLPPDVAFTQNHVLLTAAATRFPAGGKTALYDAIIDGLDHFELTALQKHVLVVLSDGNDNASRYSEEEMLDRVSRSSAIVYAVGTMDTRNGVRGDRGVLRQLARISGGVAYFPDSEKDVVRDLEEIAGNIRRGYTIGYTPANTARDGGTRRITVVVRMPGRSKLSVRSRNAYRAPYSASPE